MFTIILCIAAVAIFSKLGIMAFKLSWGILKILLTLILSPILFILFIAGGLIYAAFIILIIMGIIALVGAITAA